MAALCWQERPTQSPSSQLWEHSQKFITRAEPKIDEFLIAVLSLCALSQEHDRKRRLNSEAAKVPPGNEDPFPERHKAVIIPVSVGMVAGDPQKEQWFFIISLGALVLLLFPPSFPET